MARVFMTEAAQRGAVRQPQVPLRALKRLNVRLLVDRDDHRVGWWSEIQGDNVRRLRGKLRIGADTPPTTLQMNPVTPEHPAILHPYTSPNAFATNVPVHVA
jgi:hypothetical protein